MVEDNVQYSQSKAKRRAFGPVLLAIALLSAAGTFIASPRPTAPQLLPLPHFDVAVAERFEDKQTERAARVLKDGLPHASRVIGEQVRRLGFQIYQRTHVDQKLVSGLRNDVNMHVKRAGLDALLDLRALQSELFVEAVRASLKAQGPNDDLKELGGEFPHLLYSAWLKDDGSCVLSTGMLRLMFRNHFNRITGLSSHPLFQLSLEEIRRYYSTLLEFPPTSPGDVRGAAAMQLRYAEALAQADPSFDARPLRGILYLRLHQPGHASRLFEAFLEEHPHGRFSHLVRNQLMYSLRSANELSLGLN